MLAGLFTSKNLENDVPVGEGDLGALLKLANYTDTHMHMFIVFMIPCCQAILAGNENPAALGTIASQKWKCHLGDKTPS